MKVPIAVVLTDTHLSENNIDTNISIYNQVAKYCADNDIRCIFHCGDVFNSRKSQSQKVLLAFEQILNDLNEKDLLMITVTGNHDKTDYDSEQSFLVPFSYHPSMRLVKSFDTITIQDLNISFLSYFSEQIYIEKLKQLKDTLKQKNIKNNSILFTHIGINGAVMNNGTKIESAIKTSMFKCFDAVYVGHYHDGHKFSNITYIGASIQHNFGERLHKGFQVLYNDGSLELIELQYPQYIKHTLDVEKLTQNDLDELKQFKTQSQDFIRVILVGTEQQLKTYNLHQLKQVGVDIQLKIPDIEVEDIQHNIKPFTVDSLRKQFEQFCQNKQLDYQQGVNYFNKIVK